MIGAWNHTKLCRDAGRAPGLDDGSALPKIFGTFVLAHHRIETLVCGRTPEQRTYGPGGGGVELQGAVDRRPDQRPEIEQTRNGVGRRDKVSWQRRIKGRPVGRQHTGSEMPAGGMA